MILAVASGKGGTGKTLVATSLAGSLKDTNKIQLIDCDVEEPNDHIFLKPVITASKDVAIPVPSVDETKCTHCEKCSEVCAYHAIAVLPKRVLVFNELCHGCGACSYLCPENAITEIDNVTGVIESGKADGMDFVQGRLDIGQTMAPPVIRQVRTYEKADALNIIDASPGTSCPVVEAIKGSDFCILVTEPTPFGLNDLVLAVETVRELDIPFGIVLNRAGVGDTKTEAYCEKENIPILMKIPMDTRIAELYSKGTPLIEGMPEYKDSFKKMYETIRSMIQ